MTIAFIFVSTVVVYFFLVLAFILEDYTLGMLSALGIMCVGIYVAIYNVEHINTVLTQTFAMLSMGLGALVLINGSIEKIQDLV